MEITDIKGRVTLHNGVEMPYFGLGMFLNKDGDQIKRAMDSAWEQGYRLFDTASIYRNEEAMGIALKEMGIDRRDLFLTSKVWNSDQGYEETLKACDASLQRLGLEYLDLYLIHWPVLEKFPETWRAMETLYSQGKVRAIGVSNFLKHHLIQLFETAKIVPMVNQIEYHPWLAQPELLKYHQKHKIKVQGWAPLMRGKIFEIDLLKEIAEKYNKTVVQLVLRWNLQNGVLVIPKTVKPERIVSNSTVFDFELSIEDMTLIDGLNRNERIGPNPDNFSF